MSERTGPTPFHDLDAFVALPRVGALVMSPDGQRLVVQVATPDAQGTRYVSALWEVDPRGRRPARRLTRGATGESNAAFTPAGDLVFTARRPDDDPAADDDRPALWLLPRDGGEARVLARRPGGLGGPVVARGSGTVLLASATMPSADPDGDDEDARTARRDAGVDAVLHDGYPVRYWDHDLGPARPRLLTGLLPTDPAAADDPGLTLRDVTGHVGGALTDSATWDVTADGATAVVTWAVPEPDGSHRSSVVAIDLATGRRWTVADDPELEFEQPRISPDGTRVAVLRTERSTPQRPVDVGLGVVPLHPDPHGEDPQGGAPRDDARHGSGDGGPRSSGHRGGPRGGSPVRVLAPAWDRWPKSLTWTPDGRSLVVTADSDGRGPLLRVDVDSGRVTRLTHDEWTYSDAVVDPDGRWVYALRSGWAAPPHPVRVALDGTGAVPLRSPVAAPHVPGRLTEVTTRAADGTRLRAWMAVPHTATEDDPAPLLLWIHGGPLGSWNAWSWRWCPWLLVARGYAVLLPDPALSTGYGLDFVARGWGAWGDAPYTDLMAVTDAAVRLPRIDAARTAAMGGSFGGYMANWVAGHTDRFRAIVTHASLWALDQFGGTTDAAYYWRREMTPQMAALHSPHLYADAIVTPMLVIHGDKDYRVPIGEGLRLWWDLVSRSRNPDGSTAHRFLYFPQENHWVLTPGNATVWYSTVFAFLAQHVLDEEWQQPALLG